MTSTRNRCESKFGRALCRHHGTARPDFSKGGLKNELKSLDTQISRASAKADFNKVEELKEKAETVQAQLFRMHPPINKLSSAYQNYVAKGGDRYGDKALNIGRHEYIAEAVKTQFGADSEEYRSFTAKDIPESSYLVDPAKFSTAFGEAGDKSFGNPTAEFQVKKVQALAYAKLHGADGIQLVDKVGVMGRGWVPYKLPKGTDKSAYMDFDTRNKIQQSPTMFAFTQNAKNVYDSAKVGLQEPTSLMELPAKDAPKKPLQRHPISRGGGDDNYISPRERKDRERAEFYATMDYGVSGNRPEKPKPAGRNSKWDD
jgi:hypothetical protein